MVVPGSNVITGQDSKGKLVGAPGENGPKGRTEVVDGVQEKNALHGLSEEDLEDYRQVFQTFDKDGSGEIDTDEMKNLLSQLGYEPTPEQLDAIMKKMDTDGSGSISFDEFLAMMVNTEISTEFDRQIEKAFKVFDADHSGEIDAAELGAIMEKLGLKLSEADVQLLITEVDANGDGRVDLHEFIKFMYS